MTMNRKSFLSLGAKLGVGTALLSSQSLLASSNENKLVVLHTNDWHSRIEPFPSNSGKYANQGGASRRASLIEKIRSEGNEVLLLDAGDIFQGTPYFNVFKGSLEYKLMSEMGYDAVTLGNHDFDAGLNGLVNQLENASFSIVNANYSFENSVLKHAIKPYRIFKKGRFKVGVFGLGIELEGLVPKKLFSGTKYIDPVGIANDISRELKRKKCNLIICLSHLGYRYKSQKISDVKLAQSTENIDLIIGGHTHTFLSEPTQVTNAQGDITLINQVGWAGLNLGRLDFKINMFEHVKSDRMDLLKI
jgi:5'-nucleotidase